MKNLSRTVSEQLNQSQSLLFEVGKLAKIGGWEFNLKTKGLFFTDEMFNILEINPTTSPTFDLIISHFISADRPIITDAFKRTIETGEPFDLNLRVVTGKKKVKWINVKGKAIFLRKQLISKLIGTYQDIDKTIIERETIDKIIDYSTELIGIDVNQFNYQMLSDRMMEISGASYAILNIFDDNGKDFTTVACSGISENIKKALKILNIELKNKKWKHDPHREQLTKNNPITYFKSLSELTESVMASSVIKQLEKLFKIGQVCLIKVLRNDLVIGDYTLIFNEGKSIIDERLAKVFANQTGLVIEKINSEEALLFNELKQKQMIAGISDVIAIINSKKIVEYISPNSFRIFGWLPEDLRNEPFINKIHPNDIEYINQTFDQLIKTPEAQQAIEFQFFCKNGDIKNVKLTANNLIHDPIINGLLISFHDITQRKTIEIESLKLRQAVEHSPAVIIITNLKAKIEYVNPRFTEITGYALNEVLGQNPNIIKSGLTPPEVYKNMWQTISSGKEWRGELLNKTKSGDLFWEMASISSIKNAQGKITHYVAVKENITDYKKQQVAIEEKNKALELSNAEKDKFFSIIAHDLRGPFSALLSLSQLMEEHLHSLTIDQLQELAHSFKVSATNTFDLLSNLLEWSTLQRGIANFHPELIDLNYLINQCATTIMGVAMAKNVTININSNGIQSLVADVNMLRSTLRNLVSNSIKFSYPQSTITVNIEQNDEGTTTFTVIDQGIGMSEIMLEKLFKIDQKINREGTNKEPSTGLGLLLCKELVEQHGGEIFAKSKENEGTTIWFTIPKLEAKEELFCM